MQLLDSASGFVDFLFLYIIANVAAYSSIYRDILAKKFTVQTNSGEVDHTTTVGLGFYVDFDGGIFLL